MVAANSRRYSLPWGSASGAKTRWAGPRLIGEANPDTQQLSRDTMIQEGSEPVAGLLDITVEDPTVDTAEMAQYLFDTKC